MKKKQNIKCDVENCKHCNVNDEACNLDEIKVSNDSKSDTKCKSFDEKKK